MKKLLCQLAIIAFPTLPMVVMAGPVLDSYFPLNDGDQKTFVYDGSLAMTMSVTADGLDVNGESDFTMSEAYQGASSSLVLAEDTNNCYFTGVPGWVHVNFDPQVLLLDDSILQNGGTVRTATTAGQTGISYPATFTIRVTKVASITVPGGTFTDCRSITASEVAHVPGHGTIAASALTAYLAPGVGIIKTLLSGGRWAELVSGTVGGVPVGNGSLSQLTVSESGSGAIAPNYNGRLLQVGHNYTMTATPKAGNVFAGWSDGNYNTIGTTPKITFTMQNNMVLQANFIPNPFLAVAGRYIGLFLPNESNTLQNSGYIALSVTAKGAFSGYWQAGAARHPLSGQLDTQYNYSDTYDIAGEGPVTFTMNVPGGGGMTGTLSSANWTSSITGNELVSGKVAFTETGRYTISFTDANGDSEGSATMNFTKTGPTTLAGKLADGTRFSAASTFSPLNDDAGWPFYAPLYGGKGCFLGWMDLGPNDEVTGNFVWITADGNVAQIAGTGQLPQ